MSSFLQFPGGDFAIDDGAVDSGPGGHFQNVHFFTMAVLHSSYPLEPLHHDFKE
jgi:hypothetical protein